MNKLITILFTLLLSSLAVNGQVDPAASGSFDDIEPDSKTSILNNSHLNKLDSLFQEKTKLLEQKIKSLQNDSEDSSFPTGQEYSNQMRKIDKRIEQYTDEFTNNEEQSWLQDHLSQWQQLEGASDQFQGKLLNVEQLQTLQDFQQQLHQLSQESHGYFQQLQGLTAGLNRNIIKINPQPQAAD